MTNVQAVFELYISTYYESYAICTVDKKVARWVGYSYENTPLVLCILIASSMDRRSNNWTTVRGVVRISHA